MRVMEATRFGGPEVLVPSRRPDPVAEPGQVVVEVAVAAIDFVQTQLRRGFTPGPPLPEPPYVPGATIAGEVTSVGAQVDPAWIGRRVVTRTASGWGGNAERAVAAVEALIEIPEGVDTRTAAALLDDGSTALGLIESAEVRAGQWVLVEAAAGGLGSLLVQLSLAAGARVVGAARGKPKLDLVTELGAEAVVDYSEPGWPERVRAVTGGHGADVVFDGVGGRLGREAFGAVADGGRFSLHGAASGSITEIDAAEARRRRVTVIEITQLMKIGAAFKGLAERVLAEAAASRISPVVGQTFPLDQAAAAHAAIEARQVLGKTLLIV